MKYLVFDTKSLNVSKMPTQMLLPNFMKNSTMSSTSVTSDNLDKYQDPEPSCLVDCNWTLNSIEKSLISVKCICLACLQ